MRQFARTFLCGSLLFAFGLLATPASAQTAPAAEVGFGYQWLRALDQSFPLGLNIDVSGRIAGPIRWVGEIGWARTKDDDLSVDASLTATHFGFGGRWSPRPTGTYRPYAQALIGANRDSFDLKAAGISNRVGISETRLMLQPGVGITGAYSDRWGAFAQLDWRYVQYQEEGDNNVRFVVGARLYMK